MVKPALLRLGLLLVGLVAGLLSLKEAIEKAIASAACLERAKHELISCLSPPEPWTIAVLVLAVAALSALAGRELGSRSPSAD